MDVTRAKEILSMDRTVDVKLDGVPVWIDSIDAAKGQATVHVKNKPDARKQVPVDELVEV